MYYIVDIESRAILTYMDGTRIVYGSLGQADNHAIVAQELTRHPHAVMHITNTVTGSLNRILAPWIKNRC